MKRRQFIRQISGLGVLASLPAGLSGALFAAELPSAITDFSASQLSAAIRRGDVSCVEVMQAYLAHIHRYNPVYNAIVSLVADDELLAQSANADRALARGDYQGWMHGMPHAVKDLSAVAGLRFTSGSPMFAERIADTDSDLAARVRAAGAIFIGKTNSPEFGLGSQTYTRSSALPAVPGIRR